MSRTLECCPAYAAVIARHVRNNPMNGQAPTSSNGWGFILVTDSRTRRVCVNPDTENTSKICLIEEHQFSVCSKIRSFWKMSRSCSWNFSPGQGVCKVASNPPYSPPSSTEFEFRCVWCMFSVNNNWLGGSSGSNWYFYLRRICTQRLRRLWVFSLNFFSILWISENDLPLWNLCL